MTLRARVDGKIRTDSINWKIAQKSLGQPRVYATTRDKSAIICAHLLLLITDYVVIFVTFAREIARKSLH